jgi:predicted enzyme related to lactoylglutathione lyase
MPTSHRKLLVVFLFGLLAASGAAQTGAAPAASAHLPGKFVWFNLATPNVEQAKAFYGAVFGWEFTPPPSGTRFTIISHLGRDIGSIVTPKDNSKVKGTRWISLMAVSDAAAAVATAKAHGATVLIPPTAVAQRGTHALLRDTDGALFGVLQSNSGDPSDQFEANEFFWADLLTRDPVKAGDFYRAVAGYEVSKAHLGTGVDRVVLSAGGIKRASISPMGQEMKQPGWLPFVVVDDVPATLALVAKAGGRVLLAPSPELLDGHVSVFADPAGGVLGLVKWAPAAKN